jgi:hypothetical protein
LTAGEGYEVAPCELVAVANRLHMLIDTFKGRSTDALYCEASAFGHAELSQATEDFVDTWHQGVQILCEDVAETARRLQDTADSYMQQEEDTTDRFESMFDSGVGLFA